MFSRKRILITGGAGFLGYHLCKRMLNEGNEVICLDNFYSCNKSNIQTLLKNENFELIRHDIIYPISLEVDEIYNLACPASPIHYQRDPIQTIKTCIIGSLNMLELARRLKCKIFQASTSEVYGDPIESPQKETYWGNVNPNGIRSCYDEGKRCAESLFFSYFRQYGVPIKVGRIFNTYGPNMNKNDGRVVSNFITQALKNDDITLYGDGSQTRSFCYVDDLIDLMIKFMESDSSFIGPLNMGNPDEFSIKYLAKTVKEMTNSKSHIISTILPEDDPKIRRPDIGQAKNILSWQPRVNLTEGLNNTIKYFMENIDI